MTEAATSLFLAIDGGGTRCRLAIGGTGIAAEVETGAANVTTDFDAAIGQIRTGLERLAQQAGMPVADLSDVPAFVGLAGVTDAAMAARVEAALPFRRARIADDRPAALRATFGARDGVLAHCGTGSFFAAQIGGSARFAGGWGSVLGDEASAQWIGRMALCRVLACVDGLTPMTDLAARLLRDHDGPAGIVQFARTASPQAFGAIAPLVTSHATGGDALGRDLMRDGADHITRTVTRMGWQRGVALGLTGGIGPCYLPYLGEAMQAAHQPPMGEPLQGALDLARVLAEEIPA